MKRIDAEFAKDKLSMMIEIAKWTTISLLSILLLNLAFRLRPQAWSLGTIVCCAILAFSLRELGAQRRKVFLSRYASELNAAEDRDTLIINRIEQAWDDYCVSYDGYPPDWKYRRNEVLRRDQNTCVECGWPNGKSRKMRELHIHHIQRLSTGGTNAFSNLIALCDICHRKKEGPGHSRINPRKRKRRES